MDLGAGMIRKLATMQTSEGINRTLVERELRRFLTLCALNPDVSYSTCGPIDQAWHCFILYTREYEAYCSMVAGRFMHHVPGNPESKQVSIAAYERFFADYAHEFGEPPPEEAWPTPLQLHARKVAVAKDELPELCLTCTDCLEGGGSIRV